MSEGKSNFAALLDELETLQKSFPEGEGDGAGTGEEDDKKIKAAADGDVDKDGTADGQDADTTGGEGDDKKGGEEDEMFGKSFMVKREDGTEVEAVDGTELVKALMVQTKALQAQAKTTEEEMVKALTVAVTTMQGMGKTLKSQAAEIEELKKSLGELAGQGRGRKSAVTVHEKQSGVDSQKPDGLQPKEFMAKALEAQRLGRITGNEVATAESYLGKGLSPPERIVSLVLGGSK